MATVLITFCHQTLITDPRPTKGVVQINCFTTADPLQSKFPHENISHYAGLVKNKRLSPINNLEFITFPETSQIIYFNNISS